MPKPSEDEMNSAIDAFAHAVERNTHPLATKYERDEVAETRAELLALLQRQSRDPHADIRSDGTSAHDANGPSEVTK